MTMPFAQALERITQVRGVHGAMLVGGDDGLVVADALMEGVRGNAVAALAASLAKRIRAALDSAGTGPLEFLHLQAASGTLMVVPAAAGILVVAVADARVNVGLARLEMLRAAEAVAT